MIAAVFASIAARPGPVVFVGWDGAPYEVVREMIAAGQLPHLHSLGGFHPLRPAFPSKTAPGWASVFTGQPPLENGITGNAIPAPNDNHSTILDSSSGFSRLKLRATPIWAKATQSGRSVALLGASGMTPFAPDLKGIRAPYRAISGWDRWIAPSQVMDGSRLVEEPPKSGRMVERFRVGKTPFLVRPLGNQLRVARLEVRGGQERVAEFVEVQPTTVGRKLSAWSRPVRIAGEQGSANTYFRAFTPAVGETQYRLYVRGVSALETTLSNEEARDFESAIGAFHADAFWDVYADGSLGPRIIDGQQPVAEPRVVELAWFDAQLQTRAFRHAIRRWRADFVLMYTPWVDSAGHWWFGILDSRSFAYQSERAKLLRSWYRQLLIIQDAQLGAMRRAAPGGHFLVASDHGMTGVGRSFAVNELLAKSGLLTWNPDGSINLERTRALTPTWAENAVVVNRVGRRGGVVSATEAKSVVEQARLALMNSEWVEEILEPHAFGAGAPVDFWFEPKADLMPDASLRGEIVQVRNPGRGDGVHLFRPDRADMAAFVAGAPAGESPEKLTDLHDLLVRLLMLGLTK